MPGFHTVGTVGGRTGDDNRRVRVEGGGTDPDEEALWDRLVEGRRRPTDVRRPSQKPEPAPAPRPSSEPTDLVRELRALAATVEALRNEVHALDVPEDLVRAVASTVGALRKEVHALSPPEDQAQATRALRSGMGALRNEVQLLRNEVQALGRRIDERSTQVPLDPGQLSAMLARLLNDMPVVAVLADGQPLHLRLRVRPRTEDAG